MLTVPRILWRTLLLFVILHLAAIAGIFWTAAPAMTTGNPRDVTLTPTLLGLVGGGILLLLLRGQSYTAPLPIVFAAIAEGLFLGGIATYFEGRMPGIVLQVAFAGLSTVVAFLPLAATMRVRRLRRSARTLLFMAGGYLVLVLHNLTLMEMGFIPEHTAWGQGSPAVLAIPVGLILALLVIPSIAYALARAIEHTDTKVGSQTSAHHAWRVGLSIMALILWHFIETPRMLWRSCARTRRPLAG